MLTEIQLENFRSIRSATVGNLKTVNVFVGKNNCGKTTLLESIVFWASVGYANAPFVINAQRLLNVGAHDQLRSLFYQYNTSNPFIISASYKGRPLKIQTEPFLSKEKEVSLRKLSEMREALTTDTPRRFDGIEVYSMEGREKKLYYRVLCEANGQTKGQMGPQVLEQTLPAVQYASVHSHLGDTPIAKIIETNREKELVEILQFFAPEIKNIKIGGETKIPLIDTGGPINLPFALQGDGVVKATSILASIIAQNNSIILIDEIDNGIHAGVLKRFWKALVSVAAKNNMQIFATTHSWESLQCLKAALDDERELQNKVSVLNLVRRAQDNISVYPYDYPSFKNAIETGADIR